MFGFAFFFLVHVWWALLKFHEVVAAGAVKDKAQLEDTHTDLTF